MQPKKYLLGLLIVTILIATAFAVITTSTTSNIVMHEKSYKMLSHPKFKTTTITGTTPPSSGDWNISDTTIVEDEVLVINGSIFVESSGALILKNSTIYMNLASNGQYWIEVLSGGNMTIINSTITAYNKYYKYYIKVDYGAKFYLEKSSLKHAGYTYGDKSGLWINTNNVTIRDSTFIDLYYGIYIASSTNVTIYNCSFTNNYYGASFSGSLNVTLINSTILDNSFGVYVDSSSNVTIVNSTFSNNHYYGLLLASSANSTIKQNKFLSNGIKVSGPVDYLASLIIEDSNTVNGCPVKYFVYASNIDITGGCYGEFIFAYSENVSVANLNVSMVYIYESNNITIRNSVLQNNNYGIYCYSSNNIMIENNTISNNFYDISVDNCVNLTVSNNTLFSGTYGIDVGGGNNITVTNNTFFDCDYGLQVGNSRNITITNNTFHDILYPAMSILVAQGKTIISGNKISRNIIEVTGTIDSFSYIEIDESNTINGCPVKYYFNTSNVNLNTGCWGELILAYSENITVSSVNISAVYIYSTNNVTIYNSTIQKNDYFGFYIYSSGNITVTRSTFLDLKYAGIYSSTAGSINFTLNNFIASDNNLLQFVLFSSNTNFYLNNFIGNVYFMIRQGNNSFDNGKYGNYWSSYTGADTNGDLIGDTIYKVSIYDKDNYPLIAPIKSYKENVYYVLVNSTTPQSTTLVKVKVVYNVSDVEPLYVWYTLKTDKHYALTTYNVTTDTYDVELPTDYVTDVGILIDNEPPIISEVAWSPQNPLSTQNVTVTANVTDNVGISNVILSYYDSTWHNITMTLSGGVYVATIPAHINGTIFFKIYANDTSGYWVISGEYQVTFDGPPAIHEVTWAPQTPLDTQSVTVTAEVFDDFGVSTVILSYYDSAWHNVTMNPNGSVYEGTIPPHSGGTTITFKIYANDTRGQWVVSSEYQYQVILDNPPVIHEISWSPENPLSNQSVTVTANVTDDIGISMVILSYYDGTWHNITMTSSGGAYTATIPAHPANTTVVFKVYVEDTGGHWVISNEYQVTFSSIPGPSQGPSGGPVIGGSTALATIVIISVIVVAIVAIYLKRKRR